MVQSGVRTKSTLLGPLLTARSAVASPALVRLLKQAEQRAQVDPNAAVGLLESRAGLPAWTDRGIDGVLLAAAALVLQDAGRLAVSRERFNAAVEAAGAAGDATTVAVAALGLGGVWVHEHRSALDRLRVLDLQSRARAGLDSTSELAARLAVRLRVEQVYVQGDVTDLAQLLDEVRQRDHPVVLADALSTVHHCLLGPDHAATRLALADELLAVSQWTGRRMDALLGLTWRTVDLFLAGDPRAARSLRELRTRSLAGPVACVDVVVAALDVMLAVRAGRFAAAEDLAERCSRLGTEVGDADAEGWHGAHVVVLRWYQGRSAEVVELLQDLADSPNTAEPNDAFVAALAVAAAGCGRTDLARSALERLKARGLSTTRSSSVWLVTLFGVIEAADALGDAEAAREAYTLLLPFAERPVMVSLAVACFGSVARALGVAASALGEHDAAVEHLEAACRTDRRLGNVPSEVLATGRLARALRRRGRVGDAARADALECRVAERSAALGMSPDSALRPGAVVCTRRGRDWQVAAAGRAVVVRHSLGMLYLAELMSQPGADVPATVLAASHELVAPGRQDVLDDTARAAYKRRATELRTALDDAELHGNAERAERARGELQQLVDELARATGLGGRPRAFGGGDASERARTSVQKAIRRAIAAVDEADPVLGRLLQASIVTGARCAYLPVMAPASPAR